MVLKWLGRLRRRSGEPDLPSDVLKQCRPFHRFPRRLEHNAAPLIRRRPSPSTPDQTLDPVAGSATPRTITPHFTSSSSPSLRFRNREAARRDRNGGKWGGLGIGRGRLDWGELRISSSRGVPGIGIDLKRSFWIGTRRVSIGVMGIGGKSSSGQERGRRRERGPEISVRGRRRNLVRGFIFLLSEISLSSFSLRVSETEYKRAPVAKFLPAPCVSTKFECNLYLMTNNILKKKSC